MPTTKTRNTRARRAHDEGRHAADAGQDALRSYVRAVNGSISAFTPRAWVRPGDVLRVQYDMLARTFNLQRSVMEELVSVWGDNMRQAAEAADEFEEDINTEW